MNRTGGVYERRVHLFEVSLNFHFVIQLTPKGTREGLCVVFIRPIKHVLSHHISYQVTLSCRPLRVPPLLTVLLHSKSHTPHEYIFNFVHGAYHTSEFSNALPPCLTPFYTLLRR